ncbi:hypothetical protein VNO77_03312 [Canavalia gladiata]|uniref:Uncharacterized protein n=1 Tax=Canavalia gladiata TaxID=3824 RepID=A0AAN9RC44_CANGL
MKRGGWLGTRRRIHFSKGEVLVITEGRQGERVGSFGGGGGYKILCITGHRSKKKGFSAGKRGDPVLPLSYEENFRNTVDFCRNSHEQLFVTNTQGITVETNRGTTLAHKNGPEETYHADRHNRMRTHPSPDQSPFQPQVSGARDANLGVRTSKIYIADGTQQHSKTMLQ